MFVPDVDRKFIEMVEGGIPLVELERRLRAKTPELKHEDDVEQHAGYGDFSYAGFLGPNERLIETVLNDWRTLARYGVTHSQVSDTLAALIDAASQEAAGAREMRAKLTFKLFSRLPTESRKNWVSGTRKMLPNTTKN